MLGSSSASAADVRNENAAVQVYPRCTHCACPEHHVQQMTHASESRLLPGRFILLRMLGLWGASGEAWWKGRHSKRVWAWKKGPVLACPLYMLPPFRLGKELRP
eukprot:214435-Pelagomonas_calceolata.AAC.2